MLTRDPEIRDLLFAGGYLVGGVLLGILVHRLVARKLRRQASLTASGFDDVVVGAVHDLTLVAFTIGGAFAASLALPLTDRVRGIAHRFLLVIIVLSATWVAAQTATRAMRIYALRTQGVIRTSSIFINITRLAIFVVGVLVLLQTLGISVTPLLTALGVGGLAVALALQDTLSNLFAGVQVLASKQIRPGDFVALDSGEHGYVVDLNWRNTSIRQLPNNMVIVPNKKLAETIVTNYYRPQRELSVLFEVGVAYDSDLEEVERITIEVAREVLRDVEGGIPAFEPFVRYHTFGDSSIGFTVVLRAREFTDQYLIKHEFLKRLHRRYGEEGITIPFPMRTMEFKESGDGSPVSLRRARRRGY